MKIWLLTHSEEIKKTTGTGPLVKSALGLQCEIVVWSRVSPDEAILNLPNNTTLLIYPKVQAETISYDTVFSEIENIIILDGTWQQARKMYNQSPYLQRLTHYEIHGVKSVYNKRRNQKETGLCTAEVAIHLLQKNNHPAAPRLVDDFHRFNQSQ
ncbi:DTW domain-containing protein [Marinomonas sp. A79]|uniref:tRNA-uridine aminocarboxypropyltransferase n=1 Tax=Marinomonas vulgaris TaxID=2823372 RepID=A0ABS5HG84_9GAMM|nr:tRNA-uridine aminocarboxypropyltransferase [Marinomonas vulgaris]MBR7890024.1 DTW domain-containing protein [Marinomonas vulgaris]